MVFINISNYLLWKLFRRNVDFNCFCLTFWIVALHFFSFLMFINSAIYMYMNVSFLKKKFNLVHHERVHQKGVWSVAGPALWHHHAHLPVVSPGAVGSAALAHSLPYHPSDNILTISYSIHKAMKNSNDMKWINQ